MSKWSRWMSLRLAVVLACGCQDRAPAEQVNGSVAALLGQDGGDDGGPLDGDVPDARSDAGSPPECVPTATIDLCDQFDEDCDGNVDEDCSYGVIHCPQGSNVIHGTNGDDWLLGTPGDDCIVGYEGNDELWGLGGSDTLVGGPGDDSMMGLDGDDTLLGGDGADELFGGGGADRLEGEAGNDFLEGGEGEDALAGGACNDRLLDSSGPDQLSGGPGSDRIVGGDPRMPTGNGGDGTDACNGDECEQPPNSFSCHVDADCPMGMRCTAGSRICIDEAAVADNSCDGIDDDCDGHIDEDYAPVATSCGVGMCTASGETACSAGQVTDSCTPGTPGASDDSCNGSDDDCDGTSDEGYPSATTSCGVGACASSGVTSCSEGSVTDSCTPGTPAANDATCDGVDDDCDGNADEDYAPVATSCGVGACTSAGMTSCVSGSVHDSCEAGSPAPNDSSCNGSDDDCDGTNDEDYAPVATSCGVGACASMGVTSCSAGSVQNSCAPGTPAPSDATCNGVDDDCNGANDEDYVPVATSCGVGACASTGVTSCSAGSVQNSCAPGTPAPSDATCNGVDEDCSGTNDEDYVPVATSCGVGACASTGVTSCSAGSVQNSCAPGTPAPSDATCNGVDDDCNGTNDEDYAPIPTSCEVGGCSATGATQCTSGTVSDTCLTAPVCVAEIACSDGLDNDGDTHVDCFDVDCAPTPACAPQTWNFSVPGKSNIWGAGHTAPLLGGGLAPPINGLLYGGGAIVTFTSVTGFVIPTGSMSVPPDGVAGSGTLPSGAGIAGYTHGTLARSMVGVFLGPSEPVDPAPPKLTFADGNFAMVAPGIGQSFFIGDGRAAGGAQQAFIVPAGATRLAVGTIDVCAGGAIGCFSDNTGSYSVSLQVAPPPPIP